jgi:hypothetical protein
MLRIPLCRLPDIIICSHPALCGFKRCIYCERRDRFHDLASYRLVDPDPSDSYTLPRADVGIVASALIPMCMTGPHSVEHMHDSSASSGAHKAG